MIAEAIAARRKRESVQSIGRLLLGLRDKIESGADVATCYVNQTVCVLFIALESCGLSVLTCLCSMFVNAVSAVLLLLL